MRPAGVDQVILLLPFYFPACQMTFDSYDYALII